MALDLTDYIPHGLVVAFATVAGWVFKNHVEQDESRFNKFSDAYMKLSDKIDVALAKQAENHTEVLKILLDRKNV